MVVPEIPYVPAMYQNSTSSVGDWPPVVFWYGTDRKTQDAFVERFQHYLKRSTASHMLKQRAEVVAMRDQMDAAFDAARVMVETLPEEERAQHAENHEKRRASYETAKAQFDRRLAEIDAEMNGVEPYPEDDDTPRDEDRCAMYSLVLKRLTINGSDRAWPNGIQAQLDLLTSSGIAPAAWEELLHAVNATEFYRGSLGKS